MLLFFRLFKENILPKHHIGVAGAVLLAFYTQLAAVDSKKYHNSNQINDKQNDIGESTNTTNNQRCQ